MTLRARPPLSSSSSLPLTTLPIRLRCPLHSSRPSKLFFLHAHPRSPVQLRPTHRSSARPGGPRFLGRDDADEEEDEEEEGWRSAPPAGPSGAHLVGALDDDDGDGDSGGRVGWGATRGDDAGGVEIQELGADGGGEAAEWDPPVRLFRWPVQVQRQPEEEEDDEDGSGCEWSDPGCFLRGQEEAAGAVRTTTAMEEILAFARSHEADGQAFAEFLAGYRHAAFGVEECVELTRRMGEEGLALGCLHLLRWMQAPEETLLLSPQAWLLAVVVLGRAEMADEVLEIVEGLPPERRFRKAVLYNAAMSGLAYCGRYDDAWKVFKLMEKNNIQPDHMTSLIMLNVMNKGNASAKDAWEFFQRMDRKGVKWSLDICICLIKIFCDEGLKTEALIIQSAMEKRGIASNTSIYNTLINAYCKANQIEEAEGLFVEMKEKGLCATTVTYNILMGAYSRRLQPEVVESLLLEMQDLGLQPNARSYNFLINTYGQQKKMTEKAEDAFLRMKTVGIMPTSSTYTSLLCAYAVNGLYEKALLTYVDMKREGFKPSIETYTALIDMFRRAGDTEKLMETWRSMIDEKVPGTRVIFHMVLDGLAKHGLYVQAMDVMYEFRRAGLQPNVMTYNILMNAFARGGQHYKLPQLLKEMAALEIKPDSVTYSTMIYAYARVRDFSRAFYYHKLMVRSGQLPDVRSYKKLLNTLDVKAARKNIKDRSAVVGILKGKSSLKHRKEKKDEFWKNRKKRSMMNKVYGYPRKRSL
ncbi:pentatricopeptide repeat-containing protein At5g50280, chloroplastic [Oryza brachyantha]|uniref:Pentacotripeptide-repeat region of PRORP domain-containing protein n=1 Tax=Oryza brachyantha TaxID=4533 RepID=J3M5P0_ORYBR|nr:pentatricopeptide repeat-containing protein At5g50280, chloroplastic [Oryza brachyantha]